MKGTSPFVFGVLIVLGLIVFPFYWMLVTATTPPDQLMIETPTLVPSFTRLGVFVEVFSAVPIASWLTNSFIVAAGTTVLCLILSVLPAYALSRFRFRGKAMLALGLFVTQMLPEAMLLVPLYAVFRSLELLDTLTGLIIANAAFGAPIVTWILKGAFDAIPQEVEEAARIDGCSRFDIVMGVALPLVAPTLAATAVIAFFHGWNEYLFAQTFINAADLRPASVGIAGLVGEYAVPIHLVMATGIIYTLPSIVFYLIAQRYVVSGLTAGSVKG
ncbi:carbohydrate ABC transporter permease [Acuticoccus sp. M5D2P5]|uniref:carbohydrate ABC transporter permease n=1 Tax=Acuticoccus kalidii TaxID=2910977 RepID=UPI001F41209A|nr:carbohydrate ABC transporter permease [Acuticoccus kalidii]MCF3934044.1 carbohydrate ABC transporter permease [Acuticoccus kalidii]